MGSLSQKASTDWRWAASACDASFEVRATETVDFHAYARAVYGAGVNFMLLQPSRSNWQFTRQPLARIVLQSASTGGAAIADGVSPSGSFVFLIRNSEHAHPITLNGEAVTIDEIAVLPPGRDFAIASRGSHKWISLSVPVAVLEEAGFSPASIRSLGATACLIRAPRAAISQLVASVANAIDLIQNNPISASATRFRDIERALLAHLLAAVVRDHGVAHAPPYPINRVICKALAFLRTKDGEDLHVEHLCRASSVAERSLLRAFHKFFGVGPTQYLKLRRLNRVHRALQSSECREATVTGILTTCGVTELGRFAGAYKALFGESPSETMKKAGKGTIPRVDNSLPGGHAGPASRAARAGDQSHQPARAVVDHPARELSCKNMVMSKAATRW